LDEVDEFHKYKSEQSYAFLHKLAT